MKGSYVFSGSRYISLRLSRCTNSSDCKTDAEIDDLLSTSELTVIFRNSYVNFDDYNNPVQDYLITDQSYKIIPGFHKTGMLYIKHATLEADDSITGFESTGNYDFYSMEKSVTDIELESSTNRRLVSVAFTMDSLEEHYQRTVYKLLDLTGQLGGLYEILEIALGCLVGSLASKLLTLTIMSRMYHTTKPGSEIDIKHAKATKNSSSIFPLNEEDKDDSKSNSDLSSIKSAKYLNK